ncbi:ABC transporter permease [Cellulomonas bogoriensis]|uniref:ABC transporter permease n=1 Tax=Cellulomonas bogoriensis 69B4 = DSM 16987 TaxID=1386082 RepID=A0A0A0BW79_9CELL|nr:ABC transporter permease [Cellulomonas bogoriensis]KGM12171.1 ABC transporter permease [Cellulomonas bogoriensis 69B4 = DSM 16987]
MGEAAVSPSLALGIVVVVLAVVATIAVGAAGLDLRRAVVAATGRATVQLAVVAALLVVVLESLPWTLLYLVLMFVVATLTSTRRLGLAPSRPWAALPIAAGTVPVVALVLASGTVPWRAESLLPVAGIILGGAMTATSLAGRRMLDTLGQRAGEYEAALTVGHQHHEATLEIARDSAGLALVPPLDQTRTVGLVTLPGAFVGVLLGGGTPLEAGAAQLLVLVGLLAAEALAVLVTIHLVARRRLLTDELAARLPT